MYKTSEVDLDTTVKALLESELGFLLLQSDSTDIDMDSLLSERSSCEDRQGMFGYDTHVTYHLFPLVYHKSHKNECDYVKARANAIHNVFTRWTNMGYNRNHAKEPYSCKAFMKYIDELEWTKADYMLLMVE